MKKIILSRLSENDKKAVVYYTLILLSSIVYIFSYSDITLRESGVTLLGPLISDISIELFAVLLPISLIMLTKALFPVLFAFYFYMVPIWMINNKTAMMILAIYALTVIILKVRFAEERNRKRKLVVIFTLLLLFILSVILQYTVADKTAAAFESVRGFFANMLNG